MIGVVGCRCFQIWSLLILHLIVDHLHMGCNLWVWSHCRRGMRHSHWCCIIGVCLHCDWTQTGWTVCPTCKIVNSLLVCDRWLNYNTLAGVTTDSKELIGRRTEHLFIRPFYNVIRLLIREVNFIKWLSLGIFWLMLVFIPVLWRVWVICHTKSLIRMRLRFKSNTIAIIEIKTLSLAGFWGFGEILGKSWGNLGEILRKSWGNLGEILGKSWGNLGEIL